MPRIDTSKDRECWQFACPECGSRNWVANDGTFHCKGHSGTIQGLVDKATGEFVPRENIEFVGPEASWKAPYKARPD